MPALQQPASHTPLRQVAREIFTETLEAVKLRGVMQRKVVAEGSYLQICGSVYDLRRFRRVLLIAVGKAALPMTEGMLQVLSGVLSGEQHLSGVAIATSLPQQPDPRVTYRLGSHPLPSQASLDHASLVLDLLRTAREDTLVFYLLSGGASAMVELPLTPELSVSDLQQFYRALVHSGLNIAKMNTLRKHLSAVKGGRLARAAAAATQCTLLVSDVSPQQPEVIGSGPSMPDPSTIGDCREILIADLSHAEIPASVRRMLADEALPETPKAGDPAFARSSFHTLLSSDDLLQAARQSAEERGFRTVIDMSCDEADYRDAARHLLQRLRALDASREPVCLISAGELAVAISGDPGRGGRNQQFVLECARQLALLQDETAVLSAGSDGADGNSPAAGAVADNTTILRALQQHLDPGHALAVFDTYPLLHALGDTVITGPSGNNLRDLRLLLRVPPP